MSSQRSRLALFQPTGVDVGTVRLGPGHGSATRPGLCGSHRWERRDRGCFFKGPGVLAATDRIGAARALSSIPSCGPRAVRLFAPRPFRAVCGDPVFAGVSPLRERLLCPRHPDARPHFQQTNSSATHFAVRIVAGTSSRGDIASLERRPLRHGVVFGGRLNVSSSSPSSLAQGLEADPHGSTACLPKFVWHVRFPQRRLPGVRHRRVRGSPFSVDGVRRRRGPRLAPSAGGSRAQGEGDRDGPPALRRAGRRPRQGDPPPRPETPERPRRRQGPGSHRRLRSRACRCCAGVTRFDRPPAYWRRTVVGKDLGPPTFFPRPRLYDSSPQKASGKNIGRGTRAHDGSSSRAVQS